MYRKMNVSGRKLDATNRIPHIVLNTGKLCELPPGEFTSDAMLLFRQLVKSGGGQIPSLEGTSVLIRRARGCAFLVFHDCNGLPLLGIMLGMAEPGATDHWDFLKRLYLATNDCSESSHVSGDCESPKMPTSLPWLASHIFPPGYSVVDWPEFMQCLACLGQGLAAAIIESDIGCQWN